jgi:1-acyl-sn-glycerol-3-phosphate acyltransferase
VSSDGKPIGLGRRIYSTAFWTFLVASCPVMFVGALAIFLVTAPFDRHRRVLHLYSCFWAQIYFYFNPLWRVRVQGRDKLPWRGPAVIVANHESLADILVLFALYRPFKWVSKASVFKVPLVGWNMRLNGYVPLVRGDKASIRQMMDRCRHYLRRGVPVMIFPEGTRSHDGELRPFKDGAFHLAVEVDCPVIPVALTGTANTLPKHGFVLRDSVNCHVRVLDPVHPSACGRDVGRLRDEVRARIIAARRGATAEAEYADAA